MNINYILFGVVVYENRKRESLENVKILELINKYKLYKVNDYLYINLDNINEIDYDNNKIVLKNRDILDKFNKIYNLRHNSTNFLTF